jgi:hypothetical protein
MTVNSAPSKLKILIFGILLSFVIVSYQNCAKLQREGSYSINNSSQNSTVTFLFGLDQLNSLSLLKMTNDGYGPYVYNVNASTGVVEKRYYEIDPNDPANQVLGTFCLSDEMKDQLRDMMNSVSVCLYQNEVAPGEMCTQEYRYPHTLVQQTGSTYKLGEASSGCPPTSYDICENQIDNYRQFVNQFLSRVETQSCN